MNFLFTGGSQQQMSRSQRSARRFSFFFFCFLVFSIHINKVSCSALAPDPEASTDIVIGDLPPKIDCTNKCVGCTPCTPILVPAVVYFGGAAAWFCTCGGKLYIPPKI